MFKFNPTKEWCLKMAELEGDSDVGVGFDSFFTVTGPLHSSNGCHSPGCEVCGGKGYCGEIVIRP